MSDPYLIIQRQFQDLGDAQERTRKADVAALYLPWTQRVLNAFPLASSGGVWGDMGIPWASNVLAFYASVFVNTTNSATNFWTLELITEPGATVVATVTTAAIAANTWSRLVTTTITQPGATIPALGIRATATLSPGAIFIAPAVALLRTGN